MDYALRTPDGMPVDESARAQIERVLSLPDVTHVALMADHHKGYGVPIGGVLASPTHIAPGGVGYDIACGNKAVRTNLTTAEVRDDLPRLMDEIFATLSFGIGRSNDERVDHPVLDDPRWRSHPVPDARRLAAAQLGTIGGGNHYVDLLSGEDGQLWVACHFGSRGIGHRTATWFLRKIGARDAMDAPPVMLDTRTPLGQDYLSLMHLAGEYAYAGRDWVVDRVLHILGAHAVDSVHVHHNFAWRETHAGTDLWVVRKGATPLRPGERGFIGGSMGDISVIVRGRERQPADLLGSAPHGAGRVMSRTQATGKRRRTRACGTTTRTTGAIDWPAVRADLKARGIELRGAAADEAPGCYKPLASVLAAHDDALSIEERLVPVGVAMAGPHIVDP